MTEEKNAFDQWLSQWPRFSPYVHVNIRTDDGDRAEKREVLFQLLGNLTHFYHYILIPSHPQMPVIPSMSQQKPGITSFLARQHFYIQWKVFRLQSKHLTRSIQFLDELLTKLQDFLKETSKLDVDVENEGLYNQSLSESPKCTKLIKLDTTLVTKITHQESQINMSPNDSVVIHQIIFGMSQSFDRNAMFIKSHPLQEYFEYLIFSPKFEYAPDIINLTHPDNMTKESQFTLNVIATMHKLVRGFQITESVDTAIFSIIFFKAIFNKCVVENPSFFNKSFEPTFRNSAQLATFETIGAPQELFPQGTDIRNFITTNPILNKAGLILTSLPFFCSPLDMLGSIHEALSLVRDYASSYSGNKKDDVHSFDSIFGIFMATLVGCDLVNVEETFWFINTFSPMDGLSGQLEYAKATSAAVLMQAAHVVRAYNNEEN
ncbi:hypothetical protein TVAG_203370 [Trichomonas vaginalis G3]|uniref:VPS9 domain-containing protein n=1 Tax=Trichomonas vaginalis (strain ATCC PRA-98 / G3) TaxID=412133 RepID=A2FNH2_TRIV3|nr:VPS9 domain family [Trichomonas vaginalis G3]EAX93546.1 hypothetical protein TVAG_203370 [Trichomonas vaginalis G3]KAI5503782.1 VPS9 domain family [Trichomonas vaginalis G3]|eukprot:XP_001306476.1 hypothetical protein [Trichomonas vaginalis G3]